MGSDCAEEEQLWCNVDVAGGWDYGQGQRQRSRRRLLFRRCLWLSCSWCGGQCHLGGTLAIHFVLEIAPHILFGVIIGDGSGKLGNG